MTADFLVVGAMKSGTTSLWSDLRHSTGVFVPDVKEPDLLAWNDRTDSDLIRAYSELFIKALPDDVLGECSTSYSKAPDIGGVPARARRVLGSELKIIYMVRNPVDRLLSQYRHEVEVGKMRPGLQSALEAYPRLVRYSSYGYQLELWRRQFDAASILVIDFDKYTRNGDEERERIAWFLGLDHPIAIGSEYETNRRGVRRPLAGSTAYRLSRSPMYRARVRPLLSARMRQLAKRAATARQGSAGLDRCSEHLDEPTREWLLSQLVPESSLIADWLPGGPSWDLENSVQLLAGSEAI